MSKAPKIIPGSLHRYDDNKFLRPATALETAASIDAAHRDGGAGVVSVDGERCYVEGGRVVRSGGLSVSDYLKNR